MTARALPNPSRGVPGVVVLPGGGYRRACAEPLLTPAGPASLGVHEVAGVGVVRSMATEAFELRAGAYVALGLLAAELSRRGVAASLAELDTGLHADRLRTCALTCAGSPAFARGAAAAAGRAGVAGFRPAEDTAAATATDRSRPGLTEPPRQAMQALRLAADAALQAWAGPPPTHALVAAAHPALAAATSVQLRFRLQPAPALVLTAARDGEAEALPDRLGPLAWQELERGAAGLLLAGSGGPLAALVAADAPARAALGIGADSRVLLLDTEMAALS